MKQVTPLCIVVFLSWCVISPHLLGQTVVPVAPPAPSDVLGSDLIVWSEQQRPEPVPPAFPLDPGGQASSAPRSQRTFTGMIVRDSQNDFVLLAAIDRAYRLDDQRRAQQYEGKNVSITGTLDTDGRWLRVGNIQ